MGTSIANVALPTLAEEFGASFQQVQWVVLAYLLAITTLIVSVGRLGDLTGRRRLLLIGIAVFTGASILCALAPTLATLTAARAAQGLGAAVLLALALAFVTETVPKAKVGSAMGLLGTMSAVGTALGPSLGGLLIDGLGWQAIFLVNVPLGLLAMFLAHRHLPADRRNPSTEHAGFDNLGSLLLAATLASYTLAVTIGGGEFGPLNIALLLAAGAGVTAFAFAQTRSPAPLVHLGMLRDRQLSAGLAMSALVSTVLMATLVVGPFYLSRALGLGAAAVGLVMTVGPAVAALTAAPAGRMADRIGARSMISAGLLAIAAGSLALTAMPTSAGVPGYLAAIVVITVGYAIFQTTNNTAVMGDATSDRRGLISGMLNLSRNLGLITGASVMGAVFALASGTAEINGAPIDSVATGMHATFFVATALIALALSLSRTKPVEHSASARPRGRPWEARHGGIDD